MLIPIKIAITKIIISSHPGVFLGKGVLKICSKFTGDHPYRCRSTISIKLQNNFIETTLRHGCSPVNLPHIFRTTVLQNSSGRLLLNHRQNNKPYGKSDNTNHNDRNSNNNNIISNREEIPKWMTLGKTVLCQKDPSKGNAVDNYRPILYLCL